MPISEHKYHIDIGLLQSILSVSHYNLAACISLIREKRSTIHTKLCKAYHVQSDYALTAHHVVPAYRCWWKNPNGFVGLQYEIAMGQLTWHATD